MAEIILNRHHRGQPTTTWFAVAGLGALTVNSGLAVYRARSKPASVFFVAASYVLLLLLFACLHAYERAAPGSAFRERARRAVWPLTTLLTAAFAWKVAAVMPSAVAGAVVWGFAVATIVGGFFAIFVQDA
ncbi:hypothetical protein U9M48_029804 [Paspalum notatum var. saurae]|uniref:Uncharacterized protein n=1 Tax=Paspalum notatum var. saurae TaxID=547442 RepID=A0AAQ3U3P9_PASNO